MLDSGPPRDMPHASEVIQQSGGEMILGSGTYRDRRKEESVYYLAVRANPVKTVIDALTCNGFRVPAVR
jgi:hypothetical protein